VLAQQRIEQERIAAAANPSTSNPEAPVDPASFFATLPSSLRQSVLADMDDSMMAVLPPDIAAEAQSLRRQLEDRHRRMMQERLFTQPGSGGSLSSILRHAGMLGNHIPPLGFFFLCYSVSIFCSPLVAFMVVYFLSF